MSKVRNSLGICGVERVNVHGRGTYSRNVQVTYTLQAVKTSDDSHGHCWLLWWHKCVTNMSGLRGRGIRKHYEIIPRFTQVNLRTAELVFMDIRTVALDRNGYKKA
ncbi:hypothetical protein BaRGS_00014507 [Batillaria attramentaria]|uniref:Uncharacterized protein n=1 Tax=Batillaria attramentaria TaxID=370345 RepID=A0ABD0L443_9CAEN